MRWKNLGPERAGRGTHSWILDCGPMEESIQIIVDFMIYPRADPRSNICVRTDSAAVVVVQDILYSQGSRYLLSDQ